MGAAAVDVEVMDADVVESVVAVVVGVVVDVEVVEVNDASEIK